jgi:hypothetical protein
MRVKLIDAEIKQCGHPLEVDGGHSIHCTGSRIELSMSIVYLALSCGRPKSDLCRIEERFWLGQIHKQGARRLQDEF